MSQIKIAEALTNKMEESNKVALFFDYNMLLHNSYGFQLISCKNQSKMLGHFIDKCKHDEEYLLRAKRDKDIVTDVVTQDMVNNIVGGEFLVNNQIEHFEICEYNHSTVKQKELCLKFRIHGIQVGNIFFLIRIDPHHNFES